ncbi:alpha/beta hydrolase family protein [Ancylobacter lacus]|uniref:alpha/beta hydrolase family protein n=1 Tax=Ancylobacter lacus TaxID=2579970 RepID=UPI001FE65331|nr:prolyl oligopeptidase family serine peptidase [Ancylobacter lacus]
MGGALAPSRADETSPVSVASGVSYQYLTTWPVERLNHILTVDTPAFFGTTVAYTPARNAVRLYRVTYTSVVPERDNRPIVATGLLAVPDTGATSFPMVSYQHGTVYRKQQVPSFPDQSPETQLMIAQFAGQGYVLIGADYFGMGGSNEPQGFMVKGSHQQATYDMLLASRAVLEQMKIATPSLAIAGWSQGGFVTMAMLEKLESTGVTVRTATASAPLDVFAALNGFLQFPRTIDAGWVNSLFILSAFSYEEYYGLPGMAASMFAGEYYDTLRKAYENEPIDVSTIPSDLHKLIRPAYFDPQFFAMSAYGRIIAQTQAYRWVIKSPVRNYYGEADEVITPGVGQIAQTYQRAMGAGNMTVEAISTGKTNHRGTFATAVPQWKIWFDTP